MADDDDFDYEYDPLFDVSAQCSCEDPVENEICANKRRKTHGKGNLPAVPGQNHVGQSHECCNHLKLQDKI